MPPLVLRRRMKSAAAVPPAMPTAMNPTTAPTMAPDPPVSGVLGGLAVLGGLGATLVTGVLGGLAVLGGLGATLVTGGWLPLVLGVGGLTTASGAGQYFSTVAR